MKQGSSARQKRKTKKERVHRSIKNGTRLSPPKTRATLKIAEVFRDILCKLTLMVKHVFVDAMTKDEQCAIVVAEESAR